MERDNALGDFLRARRELVTPQEAGIPTGSGVRRVPGLRREEVAMLAGISAEYYVRLERGRDRTPSAAVIDALALVLQLDAEGTDYLRTLAGRAPSATRQIASPVPRELALLVESLTMPALVVNAYSDVLLSNAAAQSVSSGMRPGVNRLLWEFTDPDARRANPDWEKTALAAVAHLRAQAGADTADERLHTLIGELSIRSERFRRLWARHDVHAATGGRVTVIHPDAGALSFQAVKLIHPAPGRLELLVLHPEPGTPTRDLLEVLTASGPAT
ncbi:helix-turn-helix domain-containing protein [Microbacterium sp.]|uniref:helix-turn-helix domain-containing protein n=1 Tax=Microbacterium sp. TaxID=51671 RepID=UPI003C7820CA